MKTAFNMLWIVWVLWEVTFGIPKEIREEMGSFRAAATAIVLIAVVVWLCRVL